MKLKPLLEPLSEEVMPVCPLELDKLLFVSDAIATSSSSTCTTTGVCSCTSSSVAGLSGEGP